MLIKSESLQSIVMLRNMANRNVSTGTAFAMGLKSEAEGLWNVWVVTCAHVVAEGTGIGDIRIVMNHPEGGIVSPRVPSEMWYTSKEWKGWTAKHGENWWKEERRIYNADQHAGKDIAVFRATKQDGELGEAMDAFVKGAVLDENTYSRERMIKEGVGEGHEVLAAGYSSGGYQTKQRWPMVRRGAIAQITPYYMGQTESFAIDAGIFEGASGGPVHVLPTLVSVGKHGGLKQGGLIGMSCATKYLPVPGRMAVVPVEAQPAKVIPISQQHIGIGYVVPVDEILAVIREANTA